MLGSRIPVHYGGSRLDGIAYEAAGGFCRGDQPRPHEAGSPRTHRACGPHRGTGGGHSGPLSVTDDVGAAGWDAWWGRRSRWRHGSRPFRLSWPGRGARPGVEVRVACGSSGGLSGPWVVSGPCCPDRFVPGPVRMSPGRGSGRCGGLCRSVVLLGPGPRSVCVAPFASGPSLCP